MNTSSLIATVVMLGNAAFAQGFFNSNFERSTIVSSSPSGYGFNSGTANVPGWTVYQGWGDVNYSGGATLIYNNQPLDSPGISLEGTDYWMPAIQGAYSVLLQGGTYAGGIYTGWTNGASIGHTGQIPLTAQSLAYWGLSDNNLQITFNGQTLSFSTISNTPNYTIYGADVSAYAGQTGELLFTAPWQVGGGMIDNLQFSSSPVPEPGELALVGLGAVLFGFRRRRI